MVDLILYKNKQTIMFQCKMYSVEFIFVHHDLKMKELLSLRVNTYNINQDKLKKAE